MQHTYSQMWSVYLKHARQFDRGFASVLAHLLRLIDTTALRLVPCGKHCNHYIVIVKQELSYSQLWSLSYIELLSQHSKQPIESTTTPLNLYHCRYETSNRNELLANSITCWYCYATRTRNMRWSGTSLAKADIDTGPSLSLHNPQEYNLDQSHTQYQ